MSKRSSKYTAKQPVSKIIFTRERVICRIIAAWVLFTAIVVLGKGNYSDLAFAQNTSLGVLALYVMLFFALISIVSALLPRFEVDTWFMMLGATVCAFKWVADYTGDKEDMLVTLAVVVAYALFAYYFVCRNQLFINSVTLSNRTTMIVAVVAGVIGATVISVITCLRYMTFSAPNFDFGLFVNMFHNMRETGLPNATAERNGLLSHFAIHISPIYYLLLPFYFLFPSPLTLQIGQAVVLASGVIPVLLLARHFKLSGKMQILVCFIYALYPAVSAGCFYDIHENCFLAPLLLWTFYCFEREKYLPMYLFAFGVLMVKEDAAMYIIMFALFVILSKKKYLHGTALAVGALAYFGFALFMLTQFGEGVMVSRLENMIANEADGLMGAVKTALVNPGYLLTQLFTSSENNWNKIIYLLQMFLPLGLIPFVTRKPSRWLLMTPMLMNLVTYYKYQFQIDFQYSFGITAFLVYAMLLNLPDLKTPTKQALLSVGAVACCCLYIATVFPQVNNYTQKWKTNKETYMQMEAALDALPDDASLSVSTMLVAHVADRAEVYQARYGDDSHYHNAEPDVDYVVLDVREVDLTKDYSNTEVKNRPETVRLRDDYLAHGYTITDEFGGEGLLLILKSPTA